MGKKREREREKLINNIHDTEAKRSKTVPPNYTINHNNKVTGNRLGQSGIEHVLAGDVGLDLEAGVLEAEAEATSATHSAERFHLNGIEGQFGPRGEVGPRSRSWIEEAARVTGAEP